MRAGAERAMVASDGMDLSRIAGAEEPANIAFGDADRRTLYITARTGCIACAS